MDENNNNPRPGEQGSLKTFKTTMFETLKFKKNKWSRGVFPRKRLLGMCRWMGSHFHNKADYNGVTFLVELPEWGRTFSGFLG